MELSDLTAFSVQLASVMNKNDTTTYVPYMDSSSSSSSSSSLSFRSTFTSHIDNQQSFSSSIPPSGRRGGDRTEDDNGDTYDNTNERMNDDEDNTDARKDGESAPKKRRTDNEGDFSSSSSSSNTNDGPIAGKRPRRMPISSAYTNQFLIENGVKPADLEQSRMKSIAAIGRAVVLPTGDAGDEVTQEGRPMCITSFTPSEDIPTFLDVQHRILLKSALDSVDTTIQFLSNEMEALDISERFTSAKPDQVIDRQSTPILDIKECLENEYDRKKKRLIMKKISDIDAEKSTIDERFADRNIAEHISCYYNALRSYVGGEALSSTFTAAVKSLPTALPYQKQPIPEKERVLTTWDFICTVFGSRNDGNNKESTSESFLECTLRYFERRLSHYINSRVPNILAMEQLSHKKFTFADKVENFILGRDAHLKMQGARVSIWAKIYYCLMCGEGEAAVVTAEGNRLGAAIRSFVRGASGKKREFATEAYIELNNKGESDDVYYTAVLALITGNLPYVSVLNKHRFFRSTDDMIHFVLLMMRNEKRDVVESTLDNMYKSLDPSKFSAYIVFRYFVQLQKFTEAINFLWHSGDLHMKIDALHFGLAMTTAPISFRDTDKLLVLKRETIPQLTERYTAEFCLPDKEMAALYLSIGANTSQDKYSILFDASANYRETINVIKSHSPDALQYPTDAPAATNGSRKELMQVARSFEKSGKCLKAAYLYHTIGAEAEATRIICALLGGGIAQGPSTNPERVALLKFAEPFSRKTGNPTLVALVKVAAFFDAYNSKDWPKALGVLESLELLPVVPPFRCEECARRVAAVEPPEVQRYIPALMEAAMVCFKESWTKLKGSGAAAKNVKTPAARATIDAGARALTQKAAAIVTFSALLSIVVPPETCAFIVKIQAEMS